MKYLEIKLAAPAREALHQSVSDSSHLDLEYLAMLSFAGLIALFGLLQNSVAVIIGAMLISPLMNPILAGALALVQGDWILGRRAALVLGGSIAGVIALTWLAAWLTPLKQVTPEILARTNPNLLDMLIAVLAGLAGTLALRGGPVGTTIIPGVAIAVAVIPPLSVVGFALSTRHGAMAWGGFLLFVTNLVSIMISAAAVFRLMGFAPQGDPATGTAKLRTRMAVSALVLVVLAVPLVQTLRRAVTQIGLRADAEEILNHAFKTRHSTVTDMTYVQIGKTIQVSATLRTTEYFPTAQIASAQDELRRRFGQNAQLLVDQILVAQGGLSAEQISRLTDFISGTVVHPVVKEEPFDLKAAREKVTGYLASQVDDVLRGTPIKSWGSTQTVLGTGAPVGLKLHLVAPQPLEEQTVMVLASQLSARISMPVELHGVVDLPPPDYNLAVTLPNLRTGLAWRDQTKLRGLIAMMRKRPDLRLRTAVSAHVADAASVKTSRPWREVSAILSRSGLPGEQWSMQANPILVPTPEEPAPSGDTSASPRAASTGPPPAPAAVQCRFQIQQAF